MAKKKGFDLADTATLIGFIIGLLATWVLGWLLGLVILLVVIVIYMATNKKKVGKITHAQAEEIAKTKMPDLNAASIESATEMIKGTARSMGIIVEE